MSMLEVLESATSWATRLLTFSIPYCSRLQVVINYFVHATHTHTHKQAASILFLCWVEAHILYGLWHSKSLVALGSGRPYNGWADKAHVHAHIHIPSYVGTLK